MSQPQHAEAIALPEVTQAPPPSYDQASMATTAQGTGPAPTKEMPPNLVQSEGAPHPAPKVPTITPLANPQTVTPLNQLGDSPQWIDCPFCQRRALTRLGKEGSSMQILAGALCCLFCICLTCVPCIAGWCENVEYYCSNCSRKVAVRPHDGTIQTFGPQAHGQVPSQYPQAG